MDANSLHWAPGIITVHSGQTIRLVDSDKSGDPHVLAIAKPRDEPGVHTNPATNKVLQRPRSSSRRIGPVALAGPGRYFSTSTRTVAKLGSAAPCSRAPATVSSLR